MKVQLTYFKETGKYYTGDEYNTEKEHMFEIFDEVKEMQRRKILPGLQSGCWSGPILVRCADHPHDHPHLIVP